VNKEQLKQRLAQPGLLEERMAHLIRTLKAIQVEYEDASDIQFIGGDRIWVHENGKDLRTAHEVDDWTLLCWAEALGQERGGAVELAFGGAGTLEAAAKLADVRLRMTWRRQHGEAGRLALNARLLPVEPPSIESSRFKNNPVPQALVDLVMNNTSGLVLFEGPTGSGKSTLQAALVNEVNKTQARHIYTLEDPIEFIHPSNMSLVSQREVHTDLDSFYQGLQTAKRSKPSIILIGELRDLQTKRAALESAGEGALVLATSHASGVSEALATFIGAFPAEEQNDISQRLAVTLKGVVVQTLIPSADGKVVPVREMLTVDNIVSSMLRDRDTDLRGLMGSSAVKQSPGTFSKDDDLFELYRSGRITLETMEFYADRWAEIEARLRQMGEVR